MTRAIGMILDGETEQTRAFAQKPLLGRNCRQYVYSALSKAGVDTIYDHQSPRDELLALLSSDEEFFITFVREEAPCLSPETHLRLRKASEMEPEQPVAVLADDMSTYLALCLHSSLLRSLRVEHRGQQMYMSNISRLFDDMGIPVRVLGGQESNCYCLVDGPTGFTTAYRFFRRIILRNMISNGVIVLDPDSTTIEYDVRVGVGTTIYAGVLLQGRTRVGSNCVLYPGNLLQGNTTVGDGCVLYAGTRLQNARVGRHVQLDHAVLMDCEIGDECEISPYVTIGPDVKLGRGCRVGSYVALKSITLADGHSVSGAPLHIMENG